MTAPILLREAARSLYELRRGYGDEAFEEAISEFDDDEVEALLRPWQLYAHPSQIRPADALTWLIMAGRGFGKALALDTPIPTPAGWTTMGDLVVGDEVIAEDGRPCRVTLATPVQHKRRCYCVRFDDGSEIVADAEHRWLTWDKRARKAAGRSAKPRHGPEIRTTEEIRASLLHASGERNHSIANAAPLDLPPAGLPIDPYVLGVWLGDGDSAGATLTVGAEDLEETRVLLQACKLTLGTPKQDPRTGAFRFSMGAGDPSRDPQTGRMQANGSLCSALRALGLLGDKRVPDVYLRGSSAQRLALLQGLLDSDGHALAHANHVEFCSTLETLAGAVFELAASLGVKPTIAESDAVLDGRVVGRRWRVTFRPHMQVFRLARKAARLRFGTAQRQRTRRRFVVAVGPVESVPVRCIQVDSPSHLFLCGRAMIPTHNTRAGAEDTLDTAEDWGENFRGLLVSKAYQRDVVDTMVFGESGIVACADRRGYKLEYVSSKSRLYFPGGGSALLIGADAKEAFRGPQFNHVWADEIAKWADPTYVWKNIILATRLKLQKAPPRKVLTTTPKRGSAIVASLVHSDRVTVTRGRTLDNLANLDEGSVQEMIDDMGGTSFGRQELEGEFYAGSGVMVEQDVIEKWRVQQAPHMGRRIVSFDPAITDGEDSDDHGIIAIGEDMSHPRRAFVLADKTLAQGKPEAAARRVVLLAKEWRATAIVAELNQGGKWIESMLRVAMAELERETGDSHFFPIVGVWAKQAKEVRAEPVGALYELGRCVHVGRHGPLEKECSTWIPGLPSPNRMDALVHGVSHLLLGERPATMTPYGRAK